MADALGLTNAPIRYPILGLRRKSRRLMLSTLMFDQGLQPAST